MAKKVVAEPSSEEITGIISGVMESPEYRDLISIDDIPEESGITGKKKIQMKGAWNKSKRFIAVRAQAEFLCHTSPKDKKECNRSWNSHLGWCIIDLKRREITYRIYQKCFRCKGKCYPTYDR